MPRRCRHSGFFREGVRRAAPRRSRTPCAVREQRGEALRILARHSKQGRRPAAKAVTSSRKNTLLQLSPHTLRVPSLNASSQAASTASRPSAACRAGVRHRAIGRGGCPAAIRARENLSESPSGVTRFCSCIIIITRRGAGRAHRPSANAPAAAAMRRDRSGEIVARHKVHDDAGTVRIAMNAPDPPCTSTGAMVAAIHRAGQRVEHAAQARPTG